MANFLLTYHGGKMPDSPEEGAKVMKAWDAWFKELGAGLVDGGNPVSHVRTVHANGTVTDGSAHPASGYSVIKADTIDHAVKLAKGCPVLAGGATVEVSETFNAM